MSAWGWQEPGPVRKVRYEVTVITYLVSERQDFLLKRDYGLRYDTSIVRPSALLCTMLISTTKIVKIVIVKAVLLK